MIKDCRLEEKFCLLKIISIYPKKYSEITFLYFSFKKKKKQLVLFSFKTCCAKKIYKINYTWELS